MMMALMIIIIIIIIIIISISISISFQFSVTAAFAQWRRSILILTLDPFKSSICSSLLVLCSTSKVAHMEIYAIHSDLTHVIWISYGDLTVT